jgi:hypothetical protein
LYLIIGSKSLMILAIAKRVQSSYVVATNKNNLTQTTKNINLD